LTHRARLVAQGNYQIEGVNVFDTFAPVARLTSIRTVLALAAHLDWEIHQVDVRSVYLYGELTPDEVIYLKPPPGMSVCKPDEILLLRKAIYGLKQSGRRWYQVLKNILLLLGLKRCNVDAAVFYRHGPAGTLILLAHVDDLTIAASNIKLIKEFKSGIKSHVEITDLGEIHWLLGIEVRRDREARTISLCQHSYIDSIISRFNFDDIKPVSTPSDPNVNLSKEDAPKSVMEVGRMKGKPYREAVGSLMYAATSTCPDIAYATGQVARYMDKPGMKHWEAVCRVYAYLKGTRDLRLVLGGAVNKDVVGYTDADGMSHDDRHAISGYAYMIDGGAVSWSSKRQEIVSTSTTEAEYVAATHAAKEGIWLRAFISEVFKPINEPMTLYSDSQTAIKLANNPDQFNARTKHIDIRFHFIRCVIEEGKVALVYCPTNDMIADTLTKGLPSTKAKHFAAALGLRKV
jgi:Reverse transcriptase (RNA-dependent DNA polymerase)